MPEKPGIGARFTWIYRQYSRAATAREGWAGLRLAAGRLIHDERGIQHAEEALALALIAVASIGSLGTLGNDINATFTRAGVALDQAANPYRAVRRNAPP